MSEYSGPFALEGDFVDLVVTRNTSGVPTNADSAPSYSIYGADFTTALASGTSSAVSGLTGVYKISQALNAVAGFAAGVTYTVVVQWAMSSSARTLTMKFTVG